MNFRIVSRARVALLGLAALATLAWGLLAVPAHAQDFPSRPITVIVPYPPGSFMDNTMRPLAAALQKSLGQTIVIDNRAGANGVIGTQFAARAKPDGYTLLIGSSTSLAANVGLFKSLPYDPLKDFVPVAGVASTSMMFLARPDFPAKDMKSLAAYAAKQQTPLAVGYGSSSAQVALALLAKTTGAKFTGVPYKGTPQAITDLLGGQVQIAIVDVANGVPQLKGGKAIALGVSAATRSVSAPDVPTMAETWPGTQLVTWVGLVAPAGTPAPIVDKLNGAIAGVMSSPEIKQQFTGFAIEVDSVNHQELGRRMRDDKPLWLELIKAAGIQPE